MTEKINTLEELVSYLLYEGRSLNGDKIIVSVGIYGDADISDRLSPDLLISVLKILRKV